MTRPSPTPSDTALATALCHGCDAPLDETRFCTSCEGVMPTYSFGEGYVEPSRISRLLADRCREAADAARRAA